jgi:hypothetical protein
MPQRARAERSEPEHTRAQRTSAPPQNEAGIDRSGTGHGGPAGARPPADPLAPDPTTQRPGDEEGPIRADGAQRPPSADEGGHV